MRLKKEHGVTEFDQECWMELYIPMKTEFRSKKRLREELLQIDKQLRVPQKDGEPEKPRRLEGRTKRGNRQN